MILKNFKTSIHSSFRSSYTSLLYRSHYVRRDSRKQAVKGYKPIKGIIRKLNLKIYVCKEIGRILPSRLDFSRSYVKLI